MLHGLDPLETTMTRVLADPHFRSRHRLFHHRRCLLLHHAPSDSVAQQKETSCSGSAVGHSLAPYPSLALFAVPVIILEPAKPLSGYLIASGHFFAGAVVFIAAEVLKLTVVERLFQLNKKKLLSIPAFARSYGYWRRMMGLLESTEFWRASRRIGVKAVGWVRAVRAESKRVSGTATRRVAVLLKTGRRHHI